MRMKSKREKEWNKYPFVSSRAWGGITIEIVTTTARWN